jgi:DNA repair protein RecO (recombination protein O)
MIDKTEAIVLRIIPYSKSSHIVVWLTPEEGKITTIIKGALRPKSLFLGQYDLFYTCELLYYRKERNGLHIAKECAPIKTRSNFRTDWRASACASYVCDMFQRVSFPGGHQPELYELADLTLDALAEQSSRTQYLFWFELHLAQLLGVSPHFNNCSSCKKKIPDGSTPVISFDNGGLICGECMRSESISTSKTRRLGPDIVSMIKTWQSSPSPKSLQNVHCSKNQLLALKDILGTFIDFHLEINSQSREKAFEIMEFNK